MSERIKNIFEDWLENYKFNKPSFTTMVERVLGVVAELEENAEYFKELLLLKDIDIEKLAAIKQLVSKAEKQLNEILDSQLMKEAQRVVPRVRDRWEGQLSVILEIKGLLEEK